jgi:2-isopropylmalate synthase
MTEALRIFDTTLRDGEQSPGCSMSQAQKLRFAHALAELKVDVIEAGFPLASIGDFESVARIASEVKGPIIAGLARAQAGDIERCWEAVKLAQKPRIHTFLATSPIHREHKLRMSTQQVLDQAFKAVKLARSLCADVEFSAEDASRTEPEFLAEVFAAVLEAGATTLNVPDTVGYTTPEEYGALIRYLRANVRGIERAIISTHCHDDLGLAVANSLAAVQAGARQVECTINGVGERAGNASLEEIVMAIRTRSSLFDVHTNIDTRRLHPTSRLFSTLTGMAVARNKAVVGDNAFAHESGIHQHGMLQNRATYEIMKPEDVGVSVSSLVLGKHSGRHALRDRFKALGLAIDESRMDDLFARFKALADKKKEVFDADLEAIAAGEDANSIGPWIIKRLHLSSSVGESALPTASVQLQKADGTEVVEAAVGDGPVHAVFRAIERATGIDVVLVDYQIRALTSGEDAQGQATVVTHYQDQTLRGHAISTDIIEASARAFLEVINRIERNRQRLQAQTLVMEMV